MYVISLEIETQDYCAFTRLQVWDFLKLLVMFDYCI
jgi:hypothetical protein